MIQCPECRQLLPDDSAFCDQCGQELKWCPECKRPKRGTECPVCGKDLVLGRQYLSGDYRKTPEVADTASAGLCLVGNGWRLPLKEGSFGRLGGIWPELSACPYVSGRHGTMERSGSEWMLTDVGSTNGTYVNGVRIQQVALKKGDRVKIATLDFVVE